MNLVSKIILIICIVVIQLPVSAAGKFNTQQTGYNSDVIYFKLGKDDLKNPVVHEDNDAEDDLPENNAEIDRNKNRQNQDSEDIFNNSKIDNIFDKDRDNKIDEDTLLGKIMHKNIIRTDVPSYLLKEELTFRPEKGIVSKVQFYGAYQGNISFTEQRGDKDLNYNYGIGQIGAIGKFRNSKNDFKIAVNPYPRDGLTYMQNFFSDAYIVNSSIPNHKVVVGYSRNQIGKEGGSSSYILPFVTRSQIARNFGSTRALGVRLIGNYPLADYNLAVNSSDRYFRRWFPGAEFTGWVDVKPFGKTDGRYGRLVLGGGLNAGHNETTYTVGSFYLGYKYKKLWSHFEYGIADGYNGVSVSTNKAAGFNGTIGYKIIPQVQVIARYDFFDPNRDISHNNRQEYTAGINYFIKGQALKLILNYVFCQNDRSPDSHRVIFATQLLL